FQMPRPRQYPNLPNHGNSAWPTNVAKRLECAVFRRFLVCSLNESGGVSFKVRPNPNNERRDTAHSRRFARFGQQLAIAAVLVLSILNSSATTNLSAWVFPGSSGRLNYQPDYLGNRVVDASGVGYKAGTQPLPASNTVPVRVSISPVGGD